VVTPDSRFVYVANFGSNNVSVIDTSTNMVVAAVGVGTFPFAYGIFIVPPPLPPPPPMVPTLNEWDLSLWRDYWG
jgi:YVTN family beta-propeller protein